MSFGLGAAMPRLAPKVVQDQLEALERGGAVGEGLVEAAQGLTPGVLAPNRLGHTPVGLAPASEAELQQLRDRVLALAVEHGFPARGTDLTRFDRRAAGVLADLELCGADASARNVWVHMNGWLLFDLVVWRWGVGPPERFAVGGRWRWRNQFGRLWWRAELLGQAYLSEGEGLGEDQVTNIVEREFGKNPRLAVAVVAGWQHHRAVLPSRLHEDLMREATKGLRRQLPVRALFSTEDTTVAEVVQTAFEQAETSLGQPAVGPSTSVTTIPELERPLSRVPKVTAELTNRPLDVGPLRAEYEAFQGRVAPLGPLSVAGEIEESVLSIVSIEGPVSGERLHRAYLEASDSVRLSRKAVSPLNRAISRLVRKGRLLADDPFGLPGVKPATYRLPEQPIAALRELGPRGLMQVPPRELSAAIREAQQLLPNADQEGVLRHVLESYGLQRLGSNIRDHLVRSAEVPPEPTD